jgi:PTH1 family peptidyl-tRNA hydrolase
MNETRATGEAGTTLIVGLGNPESEFADTRHNLGFDCVRVLASRHGVEIKRKRWRSLTGHSEPLRTWFVLPQTYMNLSGEAVKAALRDVDVEPDRVWVVYDELDLPLCRLRIRRGGSAAGHNGVLSIIRAMGTDGFVRFRVGIGKPTRRPGESGRHYVLGRFTRAEAARLDEVVGGVADALDLALEGGLDRAMERYNRAGSLGCEELK